jgi:hypothetical protein
MSPLVRGRGSKHAIFTDLDNPVGRPPCEGVGRNMIWPWVYARKIGRPPCEGVDRNGDSGLSPDQIISRPPCEGVDRNNINWQNNQLARVALPCEGVDRNYNRARTYPFTAMSPSVRGRGSKHCVEVRLLDRAESPSVRGRGPKHEWLGHRGLRRRRPLCEGADRNLLDCRVNVSHSGCGAWIET